MWNTAHSTASIAKVTNVAAIIAEKNTPNTGYQLMAPVAVSKNSPCGFSRKAIESIAPPKTNPTTTANAAPRQNKRIIGYFHDQCFHGCAS